MNDAVANLAAAIEGSRNAQECLLLEHYDRLMHRIQRRRTGKLAERYGVEDILQEALVTAIRDFGKCRAKSMPEFGAWLNSVVDNRMRDLRKHLESQKRGGGYRREVRMAPIDASSMVNILESLAEQSPSPSSRVARHDAVKALQVSVASLPEEQREALQRRFLDGQSIGRVAEQMNKSPAAVRGLIHRAKQTLRSVLGDSSRWFSGK